MSSTSIRKIAPLALMLCGTLALGQTAKLSDVAFAGVWKVELLCTENYCHGPAGITEKKTGDNTRQTWTITKLDDAYVLNMGQQQPLESGAVAGSELRFNKYVAGTDTTSAQQVVLTIDRKGQLTGKWNIAPHSSDGVCIIRYTVTGRH